MIASNTLRKLPFVIAAVCAVSAAVSGSAAAGTSASMQDAPTAASGGVAASSALVPDSASNVPPTPVSQAVHLADLQARIPVLQAEATIAKLNADIATSNSAAARAGVTGSTESSLPSLPATPTASTMAGATGTPPAAVKHSAPTPARSSMRVVSISGFDGQYRAVVEVAGQNVSVGPGDSVNGGWAVVSITESTIQLTHGRESLSLRM